MPDESCRKCGGILLELLVCAKCRGTTQFICRICATKTLEQFHESICFRIVNHDEKISDYPDSRHATQLKISTNNNM